MSDQTERVLFEVTIDGNQKVLQEMAKLRQENDNLKAANKELNRETAAGSVEYERNAAQIKANNSELNKYTREVTGAAKEQQNMRRTLLEVRREMQKMAGAGKENTELYKQMSAEASKLQGTLDSVQKEIKIFSDGEVYLRAGVDAMQGFAAAGQAALGAVQLFGLENDNLVKSIAKVQSAMAISNSIQQISNLLQKDSRLILVGKAVAMKVVTAATMAWNAALALSAKMIIIATGGLILIVPLIIALVKYFDEIVAALKKAANWLMFWKDSTDEAAESLETLAEMQERVNGQFEKTAKSLDFEIKLMKALGAEKSEIIEKERDLLELRDLQAGQYAFITEASLEATKEEKQRAREAADNAKQELILFEATIQRQRELEKQRAEERRLAEIERTQKEVQAIEEREQAKRDKEAELLLEREQREELAAARLKVLQDESFASELELLTLQARIKMENEDLTQSERLIIVEEFLIAKRDLEQKYALEEINILEEKNEAIKDVEKDLLDSRVQQSASATQQLLGHMGILANAESRFARFAKMVALAEAIFNIARGFTKTAAVGFPQNIPMLLGYTAQTAGVLAGIQQIRTPAPPKLAKGGTIGGRSHASGGTVFTGSDGSVFEAEKGEYLAIVNKYDASRAAMLDSINQTHGKSFKSGNYFADGGLFEPQASPRMDFSIDMQDIMRNIVEEITSIPVVNLVRETESEMRKLHNIQRMGDL